MRKIFLLVVAMLMAITVQALPLRDGHFFKTFSDGQPTAEAAPTLFDQWFSLPEGTEWREVSRQTDNIGMERIEYRQYVSGIEVEYSPHPSSLSSWYTIDGRQLSSKPTTKGLYIYHGRVFVVK